MGKYLRNSRKFAEAPQNCSETQGIFAKIQGKLAESPKMFAKIKEHVTKTQAGVKYCEMV